MHRVPFIFFAALLFVPSAAWPQGDPLGPEFRVNNYTTSDQGHPSVAADSSGNFVVVWQSYIQDGSGNGIFGQRYDSSGTPLGPEFRVNTYTFTQQSGPSVAADSSGKFVVVWDSYGQDGSNWGVFAQRYDSSGTPLGTEFRVNTVTTSLQGGHSVAADSSGNFVVVWTSVAPDALSVFGQRYDNSGTPLGTEFRVNTFTPNFQLLPSVAVDSSGNFVVVWQSYNEDGSGYGVFGQRYDSSGTPLGTEFRVNTYTSSFQNNPSVDADSSGNFVVAWQSYTQDGSGYGVFGQRYDSSGTPLGPEFRVNTYTTSDQGGFYGSVAADPSGNFVVAWQSNGQDGLGYAVFGQRYDNSGTPLGPEFRVNSYTTSDQSYRSVAADSSGNFVVVWQSDTQDGSGVGVFGQRYGRIVPVELIHFRVE